MGGNALKNCTTRRFLADEYHPLERHVVSRLEDLFPLSRIAAIRAYKNKESFGDMDIIISTKDLPVDYIETVMDEFSPKDAFRNGNCFSFEFTECQIDLIAYPEEEFNTAYRYFAYNDLGNLLGRLAYSMGLKLGHDGLSYNWREGTEQYHTEVLLTDWDKILPVLGLDPLVYNSGFDTLDDIFKFVVSSKFFNKDIFLLENRNHASRIRDAKRKTYMEFLDWIEVDGNVVNNYPRIDKRDWLVYAFRVIVGFEETYFRVIEEWKESTAAKAKFNGGLVRHITGVEGKELGELMKYMKQSKWLRDKKWLIEMPECVIRDVIVYWAAEFEKDKKLVDIQK